MNTYLCHYIDLLASDLCNIINTTMVWKKFKSILSFCYLLYPPQTVFVGGYTVFTLSVRPNERPTVRMCVRNVLFP